MYKLLFIPFLIWLLPVISYAQDTTKAGAKERSNTYQPSISKKALELEESLENRNSAATAEKYEELAKALVESGDFLKAEEYLNKALEIHQKKKNKKKIAELKRQLAQVQEKQQKFDDAIINYQSAGANSANTNYSRINSNDAYRLQNNTQPEIQTKYLDSNARLLKIEGNLEEAATAYQQKAETQLKTDNKDLAIESYREAIKITKNDPQNVIKLKSEISKVYESDNKLDKAIEVTTLALQEAVKLNIVQEQIRQKKALASLLFKKNDNDQAVAHLADAYQKALQYGKTFEAKEMMLMLTDFYRSKGNVERSVEIYEQFMNDLEGLIKSDSSLVDAKIFQVTEEKIKQLEEEKALKDELIESTNTLNYVLIGSVLLMLALLVFIIKALLSIKYKNKKIALQSLRREMNPHFIFNSLNSVNQFISQNDEREANNYLTSYSTLMRNMMETSNKDFISINDEVEQITKYLKLEHLRFRDKFDYEISVDPLLDTELLIPNMLLQPNIENAIWHGLRYREEKGMLKISFIKHGKLVKVRIEDNGIGYKKSLELKTQNQRLHESRGLSNVKERIKLLNEIYQQKITFSMLENEPEQGTVVEISSTQINKLQ